MKKCDHCPLRGLDIECWAQKRDLSLYCERVKEHCSFQRSVWKRSTQEPVPFECPEDVEPAQVEAQIPQEPAQVVPLVEASSLSGPSGQTVPRQGCGCGQGKPLVDRQRPKALSPEEQEAHRKRVQNLWEERMKQKRKKP